MLKPLEIDAKYVILGSYSNHSQNQVLEALARATTELAVTSITGKVYQLFRITFSSIGGEKTRDYV